MATDAPTTPDGLDALAAYLPKQETWSETTEQKWLEKFSELMGLWERETGTVPPLLEFTDTYWRRIRWPQGFNR